LGVVQAEMGRSLSRISVMNKVAKRLAVRGARTSLSQGLAPMPLSNN
jgi:hypothetical protein